MSCYKCECGNSHTKRDADEQQMRAADGCENGRERESSESNWTERFKWTYTKNIYISAHVHCDRSHLFPSFFFRSQVFCFCCSDLDICVGSVVMWACDTEHDREKCNKRIGDANEWDARIAKANGQRERKSVRVKESVSCRSCARTTTAIRSERFRFYPRAIARVTTKKTSVTISPTNRQPRFILTIPLLDTPRNHSIFNQSVKRNPSIRQNQLPATSIPSARVRVYLLLLFFVWLHFNHRFNFFLSINQ